MQSVAILLIFGFIAIVLADEKLGPIAIPNCNCEGLSCQCCAGFQLRRMGKNVCVRTTYNVNELKMNLDLIVDGAVITSKSVGPDFIPFCVPAPPLTVCLSARQVYFAQDQAKICPSVDVKLGRGSIYKGTLPCLTMVGGQFSVTRN